MDYYTIDAKKAIKLLNSSENGLTSKEAKKRLEKYGYNEFIEEKKHVILKMFLYQFKNPLILLLVFACLLSIFLKEPIEAIAIGVIILLNTLLGFFQEYRAEKAISALKKISAPTANVIRDGVVRKIPAREIVPGDIFVLEAGDIVPADARLFEESRLQIDEAPLTGESVPSKKEIIAYDKETTIADQENMAFMGTITTYGKGRGVVTNTGILTEFGKIANSLKKTDRTKTPLQVKFEKLAKQISKISIFLVTLVIIMGFLRGLPMPKIILFSLALIVSTIPNALPLVVTVGLSLGTKELARNNMLVKKLPATESLGAATIICSDKTGTITKNQMTVTDIYSNKKHIKVSGSGYIPKGNFYENNKQTKASDLDLLFKIGYLCNNAKLNEVNKKYEIIGDPTEGALIVLGEKGLDTEEIKKNFSPVEEFPFDSDRKLMSEIFKNKLSNKKEAYIKGAPDILLKKCDSIYENGKIRKINKKDIRAIMNKNNDFAEDALRVLALAYKDVSKYKEHTLENTEKNLTFVGLVGMIDPPRDEVADAIEKCHVAGIDIMLITGDHALTTKAIAEKIGLFKKGDIVLNGTDLDKMSDKELSNKIDKIRIIARALPVQKLRIVDILQKKGHVVAMTGDGVNDAPALKKADIGISMGITGTDVAKEVSDATLTDDNFASIVKAIEVGRNVYDKLIRATKFFLSCNMGAIATILVAMFIGLPLPLLPIQILIMNILTDDFPALGLGLEPGEEKVMLRKPRNPKKNPLSKNLFISILLFGTIMSIGTLFMFNQYKDINLARAQTIAFTTLVMFQMFAAMSSRSLYPSIKRLNPLTNLWLSGAILLSISLQFAIIYLPKLQFVFGTVPIPASDWLKIILISSTGFLAMELSKNLTAKNLKTNSLNLKTSATN